MGGVARTDDKAGPDEEDRYDESGGEPEDHSATLPRSPDTSTASRSTSTGGSSFSATRAAARWVKAGVFTSVGP